MEYGSYPHTLCDREQREWIRGCPVQVKRVKLTVPSKDGGIALSAVIVPCGDFQVKAVTASAVIEDGRHKTVAEADGIAFGVGESAGALDGAIPTAAVFAYLTVTRVVLADGTVWENSEGSCGETLPEQRIVWQTDPHYEAIRRVTDGVVAARYYPDTVDGGAWRCACGQVNLLRGEADACGACGCRRAWLESRFDEAYLQRAAAEAAEKRIAVKKTSPRAKKQREGLSDQAKILLILASAVLVIAAIAVSPVVIKEIRYSKAESYLASGDYDSAIAEFTALGGYSDAADRLLEANYEKAKVLTGLDEVNMVWSSQMKCYSISEDGVLSFRSDKYTGDWEHFTVPDVVDGIVVRALEKNFFMNCKELREVTISDCVEELGDGTFFNCEALVKVNFGKNVRKLGARCFINCFSLTEMLLPDTVEQIGLRAFNSCFALTQVRLGGGISEIPAYLFSECTALVTVTVEGVLMEIGEYAFAQCTSFRELVFHGTEEQWNAVTVGENNELLHQAKITYIE